MSSTIQIADVPEDLQRRVEARAAAAGLSVSAFLLREMEKLISRPSRQEILDRISRLPRLELDPSPAAILREERDRR